jgi:predicted transcriptional regulator
MGHPGKTFHIRLDKRLADRFDALAERFSGLPRCTVMKLLVSYLLELPTDEQAQAITDQITGGGKPGGKKK